MTLSQISLIPPSLPLFQPVQLIWFKSPILTTHIIFYAFPVCLWQWQDMYKVNGSTPTSPCTQSAAPSPSLCSFIFIPTLFSSLRICTKPCMAVYGHIHFKPYTHQGVWLCVCVCVCVFPASNTLIIVDYNCPFLPPVAKSPVEK